MELEKIAKDNQAFFIAEVAMSMFQDDFASAVLHSFEEPARYRIESDKYAGYITVDSTYIKKRCSHGIFIDSVIVGRLLGQVAKELQQSVTGHLNSEAVVNCGSYRFSFKISQYEHDSGRGFAAVNNLALLPDGGKIRRHVYLTITIAH